MVEVGVREGPTSLAICPATGNLLVSTENKILIYKYSVVTSAKSKYVDILLMTPNKVDDLPIHKACRY